MAAIEEWLRDANEAVHINLVRPSLSGEGERILDEPFHPSFTYPILGDDETIMGYKDPNISLDFRANDLKPKLVVQYKQKIDLSAMLPEGTAQVDIDTVFKDFLPTPAFDSEEPPQTAGPDPTSKSWTPPGQVLHSFERDGKRYEIWKTNLSDPAAMELWRNMQILTLFFIEGASFLELDEDWTVERWSLYLLYEVTPLQNSSASPYTIAGFCTSHRYWIFPTREVLRATKSLPSPPHSSNGDAETDTSLRLTQDSQTYLFKEHLDPLQAPSRERISQFVILPPYQGQSLGSKLYETIFGDLVVVPHIYEIAVEDPNEAFDAMRDYSDIAYLRTHPKFQALAIASTLPFESLRKDSPVSRDQIFGNGTDLTALRHKLKIVERQFNRMLELHLLSTIPSLHRSTARLTRKEKAGNENDRKYYFWRLAVKARIYRQHADALDQLEDPAERVEKLEATVDEQQKEYLERLDAIERRSSSSSAPRRQKGSRHAGVKRRRVVEDDEDEGLEDEDGESVSSKKAKV